MNHVGATRHEASKATTLTCGFGLIPPGEMFGKPLPGSVVPDVAAPLEKRFARAWSRLLGQFSDEEQAQIRRMVCVDPPGSNNS